MSTQLTNPSNEAIIRIASPRPRCTSWDVAPAVIVNAREDRQPGADPSARDLLREDELRYFQKNGNNATIFIHGFNVPYGRFSHHVQLFDWGHDILRNQTIAPRLSYNDKFATTYRDRDTLARQYRRWQERYPHLYAGIDLENLNGSDGHNWFIHMEDNLNRATGLFNRDDYRKFTRMIHLAWSGDVFALDYMAAESRANDAGFVLAGLIDQLVGAGIAVNIIAHSLGNRVLLVAMNLLGQMPGRLECIAHAFMWQPAVPDTALSSDPGKDSSVLRNWNFIHAHRAAKKIVVLHSNRDNILGPHADDQSFQEDLAAGEWREALSGKMGGIYNVATIAGAPGTEVISSPTRAPVQKASNWIQDNLPRIEQALQEEIARDGNGLFTDHLLPRRYEYALPGLGAMFYGQRITREMAVDSMKTFRALARTEYENKKPRPAMGYEGPEIENDLFVRRMRDEGKLALVNQNLWLFSHSGMRIPSDLLFAKVYQDRIMALLLDSTGFGAYR
ncbi:alpha/beta hydrolase [Geoalkalibacter subterraneus]|uniref:Alpha/beta hydrolase n=1 Tax=Geoalkalibacter subterraneus TaxID=483547 RepID=A0A0B5FIB0_9BACT|nr:alpha/beta hydrolase [Geoalkalibacter subterraneus]AJF07068.1 hypothetical protein GSUB_11535 [Geoalkalibacter subterraneus]